MYYFPLLIALSGLAIGSFLNVVIYRINDLRSIVFGRSYCPKCKNAIKWYDLIPVLSYILLKTRCRHCGKSISWQYPLVEIGTAVMLLVLFDVFGLTTTFFYYGFIMLSLIVVFVHDLKTKTIPEEFVWLALIFSVAGGWYFGRFGLWNMLLGGIIASSIPALMVIVSKEKWMGAGDIKIAMILGLLLGYPLAILGLFMSFILGSIVGLSLIALKQKKMQDQLPFAPFIISAFFISLLWGGQILDWYFATFLFGGGY